MKKIIFLIFLLSLLFTISVNAKDIFIDQYQIKLNKKTNLHSKMIFIHSFDTLIKFPFQTFDLEFHTFLDRQNTSSVITFFFTNLKYLVSNKKTNAIFSNLGSHLYSKKINTYKFKISTFKSKTLKIDSPSIGLIEFNPTYLSKRQKEMMQYDHLFSKLDVIINLLHESFHNLDDGHPHSICPKGHDLEGQFACDQGRSGSYYYSKLFVNELLKVCRSSNDCTNTTLNLLQLTYLDFSNRIIKDKSVQAIE